MALMEVETMAEAAQEAPTGADESQNQEPPDSGEAEPEQQAGGETQAETATEDCD